MSEATVGSRGRDDDVLDAVRDFLVSRGHTPLSPLAGTSEPPRLKGSLEYLPREDAFTVALDYADESSPYWGYIAAYVRGQRRLVCVAAPWVDLVTEYLAVHGLEVEQSETLPARQDAWLRQSLRWEFQEFDQVDDFAIDPKIEAQIKREAKRQGKRVDRLLPDGTAIADRRLSRVLAKRLAAPVAAALAEIFGVDEADPYIETMRNRPNTHPSGVLSRDDLASLRAVTQAIAVPDGTRDAVLSAAKISRAHVPILAALRLRDAEPRWWDSLPWTDRVVARGSGDIQQHLWEMSARQAAATAQPQLVKHILEGSAMNAELPKDLNQNDEARLWLAVGALSHAGLVEGEPDRSTRHCRVCDRDFRVDTLTVNNVLFTGSDTYCRLCSDDARWGYGSSWQSDKRWGDNRNEGIRAAIRALTEQAGGPPPRKLLSAPIVANTSDDRTVAIALRLVLPPQGQQAADDRPWTEWLSSAGVLGEGWRPSRGTYTTATDGHPCRSLFERHIDDYLSNSGINHECEPPYPLHNDLNPNGFRADWRLDDATYVEAAGMTSTEYLEKMDRKRALAELHGIPLIVITPDDLDRLHDIFKAHHQ